MPKAKRPRPSSRSSRRTAPGGVPDRPLSKTAAIILLALVFILAFALETDARKTRVPGRNFTEEKIENPHKPTNNIPTIKVFIDGKYYMVPDRAKMDSLGIEFKPRIVYVCSGPYAECFHLNRYCRGLSNCSKKFIQYREDSIPRNLRPCHICSANFHYIDSRKLPGRDFMRDSVF